MNKRRIRFRFTQIWEKDKIMWCSMSKSRCYLMRDRSMESGRAGQGTEREVVREEEERRERRRGEWRLSSRELVARLKPSPGKKRVGRGDHNEGNIA